MKRLLFLSLLLTALLGHYGQAQTPAWQLALSTGNALTLSIATAPNADVYLTGSFTGSTYFGNTLLQSAGGDVIFIAKWSTANQRFVWAQRAGGTDLDSPAKVVVQGTSVYLCGQYASSAATFGTTVLTRAGGTDLFVAKLTDTGLSASFTWVQRAGGIENEQAVDLAVLGADVYITGFFSGFTTSLGTTTLTNANTTNSSYLSTDILIAKLTDAGSTASFNWAKRAGGTEDDYPTALAATETGVCVVGYFKGPTVSFGSTTLNVAGVYNTDAFITKLDEVGTFKWTQQAGGGLYTSISNVAVQGASIYVTGHFQGPTATLGNTTLTSSSLSSLDVFIAKLTDASSIATYSWVKQISGTGDEHANAIVVVGASLYVAGEFSGVGTMFGASSLTSLNGSYDVFVTKLLDAGATANFVWTQQGGGTGSDSAFDLSAMGTTVYLTGWMSPPAIFGSHTITTAGSYGGYFAAIADTPLALATASAVAPVVEVYPNPAHGRTTVVVPTLYQANQAILTLRDAVGHVVRRPTVYITGLSQELDLVGLPKGLYLLQVQLSGIAATRRIW